jgi:hypothetical protein
MVRETHGVPYLFGNRHTDARFFPEIRGIATAVLPLYGSPRAKLLARTGLDSQRMLVELVVARPGIPERWLEGLEVRIVEADGTPILETALCRVVREKTGQDGFHHLFIWTYPFAVKELAPGPSADIVLRDSSGHEWSENVSALLRAA